ncbi:MAG: tRNA (adenosine(37)-N6)-dimethylallyltransferase MiaA [Candidatus Anoxymicrobium japonicum]|uniref:tRNA dimethylallyltransferase n=1 Tax=Candidatus Anoxymicrobium japonicum TaxID=2013648 RepID=A0A2N3G879_9ACTN|nr:MAG: tRNA (adenosine(37)-N6)-dimethylallyltransferase MiaA [Candidatus Anoxymicrobium japonicum]
MEPGTKMAAIVGPTAIGKTAVAVTVAAEINAEIVSIDAIQVYRGMDIGANKPTKEEREAVPFHMLDVVDPKESFSVARFKELADEQILDITSRGGLPLLVGGSGLYYRAVVDDLNFANGHRVDADDDEFHDMNDLELHKLLENLNHAAALEISPRNRRRVLRAIEVARQGDRLMSERQRSWSDYQSPYDARVVGLKMDRVLLRRLIDERVDRMMAQGLVDEVMRLKETGLERGTIAAEALGYRQILEHLDGEKTLDEAVDEIKRRTRNYAKRQMTWFKADPRVKWFDVGERPRDAADMIISTLKESANL